MGGYLQSLLYGYVGFDIDDHFLTLNPQLPPSLTWMGVRGTDYVGSSLDVTYDAANMNVTLTKLGSVPLSLTLKKDGKTVRLFLDSTVTAACQAATIQPSV
jgi:trehalose/maltose hydrolase-like predicted phosphorylase